MLFVDSIDRKPANPRICFGIVEHQLCNEALFYGSKSFLARREIVLGKLELWKFSPELSAYEDD